MLDEAIEHEGDDAVNTGYRRSGLLGKQTGVGRGNKGRLAAIGPSLPSEGFTIGPEFNIQFLMDGVQTLPVLTQAG